MAGLRISSASLLIKPLLCSGCSLRTILLGSNAYANDDCPVGFGAASGSWRSQIAAFRPLLMRWDITAVRRGGTYGFSKSPRFRLESRAEAQNETQTEPAKSATKYRLPFFTT